MLETYILVNYDNANPVKRLERAIPIPDVKTIPLTAVDLFVETILLCLDSERQ